jgi:hypothetical protein
MGLSLTMPFKKMLLRLKHAERLQTMHSKQIKKILKFHYKIIVPRDLINREHIKMIKTQTKTPFIYTKISMTKLD